MNSVWHLHLAVRVQLSIILAPLLKLIGYNITAVRQSSCSEQVELCRFSVSSPALTSTRKRKHRQKKFT